MPEQSINAHIKQAWTKSAWVWFNGTGALKEGQGVCYNWDYGTAATRLARRTNEVEVPTILNAPFFAGVATRAYTASAGGQMIEIYLPGSTCNVWTLTNTVIGVGRITCHAGAGAVAAGLWTLTGFPGKGSAIPLQTVTAGSGSLCLVMLEDGEQSGLVERLTPWTGVEAEAKVFMVGGVSYFSGSADDSGAKTFALADGTKVGQRKGFFCSVVLNSDTLVVTPASTGVRLDGSTTLASFTMETAQDAIIVKWSGLGTGATWSTESLFATTEG